jgi:hypothetical protein
MNTSTSCRVTFRGCRLTYNNIWRKMQQYTLHKIFPVHTYLRFHGRRAGENRLSGLVKLKGRNPTSSKHFPHFHFPIPSVGTAHFSGIYSRLKTFYYRCTAMIHPHYLHNTVIRTRFIHLQPVASTASQHFGGHNPWRALNYWGI